MDKEEWGGKFHLTAHSIWASPFFFFFFSSFFDFYIFLSLPFVSFPFLQSLSYRSDLFVLLVIIALFGYFGPFLFPRWDSFPLSLSLSSSSILSFHPLFCCCSPFLRSLFLPIFGLDQPIVLSLNFSLTRPSPLRPSPLLSGLSPLERRPKKGVDTSVTIINTLSRS